MTLLNTTTSTIRQRFTVSGVVQGVGFRPFIYGLATRLNLSGFVGNNSSGVFIELEGPPEAITAFQNELRGNPPPLAHIESVAVEVLPVRGGASFEIVHSADQPSASTLISPDMCICPDCLRELFDPQDRRYHYPFINCTHCGPRFTITRNVPYDRPLTTMATFPMCPMCQAEYMNPLDRRFHAQPNACPDCGPHVWLMLGGEPLYSHDDAIHETQRILAQGGIVAVKGIGGFHLACDANNEDAVATLRARKGRVAKPFAIMARDMDQVREVAHLTDEEAALLNSRERPILLLQKSSSGSLSELVAPGNDCIGVMLPYTPLHYLLMGDTPLVMTSGNLSGEPLAYRNDDALTRLAPLADAFLLHNRDIHVPCDDSVVRVFQGAELPVRRSRGYAPFPVKLPTEMPCVLAAGAELKNTFCLTKDRHAFMSQHIGDMENLETLAAFRHAVEHFAAIFRAEPEIIACDLHPRYLSSRWAEEEAKRRGLPLVKVQHHHAHIASVMAENGCDGSSPVIGICFDGTGYGTDDAIWGGEVLIADYRGFERAAYLKYVPLPGGDGAVKHPSRLALTHLWAAGLEWDAVLPPIAANTAAQQRVIRRQLETGFNTVQTSSMGRLFDAVAALAGLCQTISYEAQAAIELEAVSDPAVSEAYPFELVGAAMPYQFDPAALLAAVVADVRARVPAAVIAAKFHNAVAALIEQVALRVREDTGLNVVALSGGVFQNTRLLGQAVGRLQAHDFTVLVHHQVPPNDGGLALGQAIIAGQESLTPSPSPSWRGSQDSAVVRSLKASHSELEGKVWK